MESKAIFLDRDGVINHERKDYVKNINEFIIFEGVSEAIKILKEYNFLVIIITNQSAINRKLLSVKRLNEIHSYLQNHLKKNHTFVDAIYYCPHTPKENCSCRKPKPGMILKAVNDFNINLKNSHLIGNSQHDVQAAKLARCNGILLNKNQNLLEVTKKLVTGLKNS